MYMHKVDELEKKKQIKINADTELIVKKILVNVADVEAIILCGGFGRNEGSWIIREGTPSPYNDYDVAVVTDTVIEVAIIEKLRKELANEIGIHWVDIDFYSRKKITNLRVSIKNYDLLYGSKVIYGNKNITRDISMSSDKIGIDDVETLYFTRLWTFFGTVNGEFKNLDLDEAIFFRNQMAKAILAVVDVVLIKKKSYTCSYRERVVCVERLYPDKPELVKMAKWALNEKLNPTMQSMYKDDSINLYNTVYDIYKEEMIAALANRYVFGIDKPMKYAWNYYTPIELAKKIYLVYVRNFKGYPKACKSKILQNAMFLAYNDGDIDERYMGDVRNMLKKLGYEYALDWKWNELCPLVAYIRNEK